LNPGGQPFIIQINNNWILKPYNNRVLLKLFFNPFIKKIIINISFVLIKQSLIKNRAKGPVRALLKARIKQLIIKFIFKTRNYK
jgi:hypothetical protein